MNKREVPIRVMYDITRLIETNGGKGFITGVGNVLDGYLRGLTNRPDIHLLFFSRQDPDGYGYDFCRMIGATPETDYFVADDRSHCERFSRRMLAYVDEGYRRLPSVLQFIVCLPLIGVAEFIYWLGRASSFSSRCKFAKTYRNCCPKVDVYFSPMYAPPVGIRDDPAIRKLVVLYDLIPLTVKGYKFHQYIWLKDLVSCFFNEKFCFAAISNAVALEFKSYCEGSRKKATVFPVPIADSGMLKPCSYIRDDVKRVREKYGLPPSGVFLFHISTLDARKNVHVALLAFAGLCRDFPDLYFILGGGGGHSFLARNRGWLKKNNVPMTRIVCTGFIDSSDLSRLYSEAAAFIFISTHEGFGLPVLEAMRCGCPVVVSNIPPLREIVGESYDSVVETDDVEGLEKAIRRLLVLPKRERIQLGEDVQHRAERFNWDTTVSGLVRCIQQIVNDE